MDDASSLCREASRFDRSCRELLERRRINKLPVVVDGRVVGIFTDRDLRDAFPSLLETLVPPRRHPRKTGVDPEEILVEDVMTPNVITLALQDTVDEAARIMRRARIGAVPVVEHTKLVGIVTRSDVLKAYAELYGRMRGATAPAAGGKGSWARERPRPRRDGS